MKKYFFCLCIISFCFTSATDAQVGIFVGPRMGYGPGYGYPRRPRRPQQVNFPPFKPYLNLSFGYGFPNLDVNELPSFYNLYRGSVTSQTGPFTGALDYRFARQMSLGIMVAHGNVTAPYYNYNDGSKAFEGSLESWSVMLDFMHYIPVNNYKISPYIRTAIGINTWQQNYTDASGNKIAMDGNPSELAYQVGIGATFYVAKHAGLFLEAGYGKYILHGGLSFKF
jgi:hypothetical protein